MLDNPDLIASLIGFDGLLAIALTAIATRLFSDSSRAEKLEAAKDAVFEKVSAVESTVEYIQGRLEGLAVILEDGRVTPSEVATVTSEVAAIRDRISEIMNPGDEGA